MRQIIVAPGMKIATRAIDATTRSNFSNAVWQQLSSQGVDQSQYQDLLDNLSRHSLTIQKYAQSFLTWRRQLLGVDDSQITPVLDELLILSLSPNDRALLQTTATPDCLHQLGSRSREHLLLRISRPALRTSRVRTYR